MDTSSPEVVDLNSLKFPGTEELLKNGKEDDDKRFIREDDQICCYSWSTSKLKWLKMGVVVSAVRSSALNEEKKHKYIFTLNWANDKDDSKGKLKIEYFIEGVIESKKSSRPKETSWFVKEPPLLGVILVSGGHFAASIFEGKNVILHKTFHSYTVRAKQGGSQSGNDSKSGTSHRKSAGSSLRRYNEASFAKHIQDLLISWTEKLNECISIFYRAVSANKNILFNGKNPPLNKCDVKLRTIPFQSRRPTFTETKRVHSIIFSALTKCENCDEFVTSISTRKKLAEHIQTPLKELSKKSKRGIKPDRAKSRSPPRREQPEPELPIITESDEENSDYEYVLEESIVETLTSDLKEMDVNFGAKGINRRRRQKSKKTKEEELFEIKGTVGELFKAIEAQNNNLIQECFERVKSQSSENEKLFLELNQLSKNNSTILHVVAKYNHTEILWQLLELGCDPTLKNKDGKYPYDCADNRECRNVFRRFMGKYPEKYDYIRAQIPGPLTEDLELELAERRKAQNRAKREREKKRKEEIKAKQTELDDQKRFLNLSDREKRALAAEKRILTSSIRNCEAKSVLARCFECALDITGKVPFEYNKNIFCTPACLAVHRKKFPTKLTC